MKRSRSFAAKSSPARIFALAAFVTLLLPLAVAAQGTDTLEIRSGEPGTRFASSQPVAMPSIGLDVTRMLLALAIVIGLIFVAKWFLKRFYNGAAMPGGSRAVQVLNRTVLAPKQQILLLQVGRRVVVVGESNGNLTTLAQIDDPDEIAQLVGKLEEEKVNRSTAFGGLFGRAQKKLEDGPVEPEPSRSAPDAERHEADASTDQMRSQLSGLLEKVKSLRGQINRD